jgi:hypothetical protein
MAGESNNMSFDYNSLRAKLGLPTRDALEAKNVDVGTLPLIRLRQLAPEQLSDEQLLTAYGRAWINRVSRAIRRLAPEILKRPTLKSEISMADVHYSLSVVATSSDDALESILRAEQISVEEGNSPARLLLHELDLRMLRGEPDECQRLIATLQSKHMSEPGIGEALYSWLVRVGAITPDGKPAAPRQQPPAAEASPEPVPEPGGVWTPDAGDPTPPGKDKPGLWVPGMD